MKFDITKEIKRIIHNNRETHERFLTPINLETLKMTIEAIIRTIRRGNKILIAGNGGSASQAQHLATELIIKFEKRRKGIPAICLNSDISVLTACSNDFGYEEVFSKQIEALGKEGDLFIGITTSGISKNIINALEKCKEKKIQTVCLNGRDGGLVKANYNIIVRSQNTARIQEVHLTLIHIIAKLVEELK